MSTNTAKVIITVACIAAMVVLICTDNGVWAWLFAILAVLVLG